MLWKDCPELEHTFLHEFHHHLSWLKDPNVQWLGFDHERIDEKAARDLEEYQITNRKRGGGDKRGSAR
jgi:hypothetical protein